MKLVSKDILARKIVPGITAIIFLAAAVSKLVHPADILVTFQAIAVPESLRSVLAINVISIELITAFALLRSNSLTFGTYTAIGLLACFSLFLLYLLRMPTPPGCGCGGLAELFSSNRLNLRFGVGRNAALLMALSWSRLAVLRQTESP